VDERLRGVRGPLRGARGLRRPRELGRRRRHQAHGERRSSTPVSLRSPIRCCRT
jgi:hypothetical protein